MILSFMFQMGLQEIVLVRHECRVGKSDWKVLKSGNIIINIMDHYMIVI